MANNIYIVTHEVDLAVIPRSEATRNLLSRSLEPGQIPRVACPKRSIGRGRNHESRSLASLGMTIGSGGARNDRTCGTAGEFTREENP
jgi:hypothetical protein